MQDTSDEQSPDDDSEWRFSLDDVGEDNGAAEPVERPPMEPGSPSLENALFVLIGVLGTLLVFVSL